MPANKRVLVDPAYLTAEQLEELFQKDAYYTFPVPPVNHSNWSERDYFRTATLVDVSLLDCPVGQ